MGDYEKLRQEFESPSFREKMKKELGNTCCNCGSKEKIEYHHIVPLKNGGTNNLGNITPLCQHCHCKAHNKIFRRTWNNGRPKAIEYEEAEPILDKYFNLEIGTKEAKELLGVADKNKSTWYRLTKEYKEKHDIPKSFYNNIDLLNSQKKRVETRINNGIKKNMLMKNGEEKNLEN